jgi:para-nitrobenzyl esterase
MPAAEGLFRRAAMQSGATLEVSPGRAQWMLDALAAELGVAGLDGLRTVDVDALVEAQQRVEAAHGGLVFVPCAGPELGTGGPHHAVPLLAGTNVDEVKLLGIGDRHRLDLDEAGLRRRLGPQLGDRFDEVVAAFAQARSARGEPVTPAELFYAVRTELLFRGPTLAFADAHAAVAPTYTYLFEWRSPLLDGWVGAAHVVELPFVFGLQGRGPAREYTGDGPEADRLGAEMMGAWVAFARGEEPWERHDPATRLTRCFGEPTRTEAAPREPERAAVAALRAATARR